MTTQLASILPRLASAISMVAVAQRSLAAREAADADDEADTLKAAIAALRNAYDELDRAT